MSQTLWLVATGISVVGLILFGLMLNKLYKARKAQDAAFMPVVLRFKYDTVSDDPIEKRFTWLFLAMLFYVGLALAVVTHNASDFRWLRHSMYVLASLACASGAVESLCVIARKNAARYFGLIKWALFAVWTAGMFAGLFIKGWAL